MTTHGGLAPRQDKVIIGLGNALRRDDGVGPLVLDACRYEPVPACDLVEVEGAGTRRITDAWRNRELAIIVDALCIGSPAGTVHDFAVPQLELDQIAAIAGNSEFATLSDALTLGGQLGHLPQSLRLFGIEPADLKRGFGLSPVVAASMDDVVQRVRASAAAHEQSTPDQ